LDRLEAEMEADSLHTDGNAIGGMLQEVFAAEVTAADRRCQSCRVHSQIGAHRLYTGAGYVLRCPNCGDLAAVISSLPDRNVISLHGTWSLARPSD
jgi:Family of unknown function (DUF6510)